MTEMKMEDMMAFVDKASRYLGSEVNSITKDPSRVKMRVALAFPDLYEIGTSHFGVQILYSILNREKDLAAERVFAPGLDMARLLKKNKAPLLSLESRTPLDRFDILGFSLLYELNYTNMLLMLDLAGIPFLASQRDSRHPLVIAGGPCACNPEPVAEIFDAMVIGDGETVLLEMCRKYLEVKQGDLVDKAALLEAWSRIEGVYVPGFFHTRISSEGFQITLPVKEGYSKITRAIRPDLDTTPFPEAPIIPWGKPVHDRLRIEVSRGCSRGCRFCQAGMIYRPVRERSLDNLLNLTRKAMANTGFEDLSLLSLSTGDYSCLVPLMGHLIQINPVHPTAVSFPSIRAETLTPELMNMIKRVRKTGFTIAPEAGSQRLRNVINKNISEEDIVKTVDAALKLGWQGIKLYFMVGLPTETLEDVKAMESLVRTLLKIKGKGRRPQQISVSVAPFIPKPHTPFQWESQISLAEAEEKIQWLKDHLHFSRVSVKWQNPRTSLLEGLFARGDRRLANLLINAYQRGCVFDGWSDQFRFDVWVKAMEDTGIQPDFFTTRKRSTDEPLPWDHVDMRISRDFLLKERENAFAESSTPDCRWGKCSQCGVCDHETVMPVIHSMDMEKQGPAWTDRESSALDFKKWALDFSKTGEARFLGHLEMINVFVRALRRSGMPVKYSEGFHPKPRISFEDTLPVGMESTKERFFIYVDKNIDSTTILEALNLRLPPGLVILSCAEATGKSSEGNETSIRYQVTLKDGFFNEKELEFFHENEAILVSRINKKGIQTELNLKDRVSDLTLVSPSRLIITLKPRGEAVQRPAEILREVFHLSEDEVMTASVIKC
jgi:radical SAM family uncharacterized protein/radical SAM-linked protein